MTFIVFAFQCLSATWYQHVDVHMFVASPIFLYGFWKFGYKFLPVVFAVLGVSNYVVYRTARAYEFDLISLPVIYFEKIYVKTHARLSTWMFGLVLGYVLYRRQNIPERIGKTTSILLWTTILYLIGYSIISPWLYLDFNNDLDFTSQMHPIHRLIWAGIISTLIYNCARQQGGAINWFLTLPFWKPLARLNYGIFLVHVQFIVLTGRLMRKEIFFHGFLMTQMGLGNYLTAVIVAVPMILCVEMPFVNLEADWRRRQKRKVN